MQSNNTKVVWTVIITAIILLVAGFMAVGSINTNNDANAADITSTIDNKIDTKLDSALGDFRDTASALSDIELPELGDGLCDNIDGCNGWRLKSSDRSSAIDRVTDEITDSDNRDLFRAVEDFFTDLDDNDDITSVELHKIGRVRSNEELDSGFDLSDTLEIYGEFVLEIEYDEDGSGDSNREFVKVSFVLDDLEDGIDSGEIKELAIVEWDRDRSLNSN